MENAIGQATTCIRCGKPCRPGESANPKGQPFRRARKGLCANCITTHFLLIIEPIRLGLEKNGLDILKDTRFQTQFDGLLEAGGSDLKIEEIDWGTVIDQWDLPWPKGCKP